MEKNKDTVKSTQDFIDEVIRENPGEISPNIAYLNAGSSINDYKIIKIPEMQLETPPVIEFVAYPILPVQGIGCIYAAAGIGKTLFTLNLAYAIAGGGNFLKYTCAKPRRVIYVDGEMPYSQLHARLMQIVKTQGNLDFPDNFMLLTPDKIAPVRIPMIDEEAGQQIYQKLLEKHEADVIIFDNLSMLASFDENKSHEWKPIQNWLLFLRSIGKTVIIIHHAGKEKTGYRGTSRMLDCVDTAISLQPVINDELEDESVNGRKFKIVYQKSRGFGGKDSLPFEVNLYNGIWDFKSLEQTEIDRVVEMVSAGMTQRDIAKELICSQSKVFKLTKQARKFGLIRD